MDNRKEMPVLQSTRQHLISLHDLSDDSLREILMRGLHHASDLADNHLPLKGMVIGIYFRLTSTRTRTAFSVAALKLGAQIISYGPKDLQENTGESIEDTAKVLSSMLDGLVFRTAGGPDEVRYLASQRRMAVINAMSQDEHPTQALADLTTMLQIFRDLSGLRVLYVGEGNNTAAALSLALPRFTNTELFLQTPKGFGLAGDVLSRSKRLSKKYGSSVIEHHNMDALPSEVDVVYTTRWRTTGTQKADPNWETLFKPFSVSERLMEKYPGAVFMHDLPAHRGEEVDKVVIDGPTSVAFRQAENKLHSAKAILEWCLMP